jgi:hypothetical membrane protein
MDTAVSHGVGEHGAAERISRRLRVASVESLALGMGALAFAAVAVVAFFVFAGHDLSIAGAGSVGQFAAIACCLVTLVAYGGGRVATWSIPWYSRPREHRSRLGAAVEAFDSLAISVAHAVVVLLLWTVLSDVLARSFQDAQVFAIPATLLVGTAAAVSAYYVFLSAANMNPLLLSAVLAIFLVVGALTSMLTASNPHWWKQNLSVLGISDDWSAATFNITVIVGGILVTAIARYATDSGDPERRPTRGELQVRTALVIVGAMLACVGLFPVDRFFLLHNTAATGMAVVFCILAVGIRWMMPHLPRAFYVLGWVFIGVIVLVALFFAVGYYNLTAVELVAAVLIFSWIIVFLRITEAAGSDAARREEVGTPPASTPPNAGDAERTN